jgi:hypothetical protein
MMGSEDALLATNNPKQMSMEKENLSNLNLMQ